MTGYTDFEINDAKYRAEKMPAKIQLKIIKRLAPIIGHIAAFQERKMKASDMIATLSDAIGKLSDDDLDFVLDNCMMVTRMEVSGRYMPLYNMAAKQWQYQDMSLVTVMQITQQVLGDNLANFWPDLPSSLGELGGV
jgi:hypothetical protein